MPSDLEIEAAAAQIHDCTPFFNKRPWAELEPVERAVYLQAARRTLLAAAAVRAKVEVSDAAFSAGVYAVADALCASQYVNAPDASFVLTLAHRAFAAGIAAQAATPTEAK